jgi:hypothetical protein
VCVHAGQRSQTEAALALRALESAYDRLVLVLGLPAPLADAGLGGSDALDAYLTEPTAELEVLSDPPPPERFTVTSAFCELPVGDPVLTERAATLCLGEAIVFALDASETPHLRRAFATWLWWAVGVPTCRDVEAIDLVQAHPERAIATRERSETSEGSAIFFEYLESARSALPDAQLSAALFSAAVSNAHPLDLDYHDTPDLFDVLRHSLDEEPSRFAALMVDFAVARAFIGDRDDGLHLPHLGFPGAFGRIRFDWSIRFSSLPRRVLVSPPIESTGAVLIRLDLDEVGLGAALGFRAEWEAPVNFQWQLVKVDRDGVEVGRVDVPFQERARESEARVTNLEGARWIYVVGTNLESIDLAHPFDPDVTPSEPHGATVYLVRM